MIATAECLTTGLFLATDRCDRCCAQARMRVGLPGGELQFCKHHARMHRAALESVALWIEHDGERIQ